jgi:hypothetical protein
VKDLVTKNVEDGHIIFFEDASNIVSHPSRPRKTSVPMRSARIGDHCYYGLCDIGASSSAIPYELYREIMHEIGPCELEEIDVVIQLAEAGRMTTQLGTPRGRYDKHSSKFSLSKRPRFIDPVGKSQT